MKRGKLSTAVQRAVDNTDLGLDELSQATGRSYHTLAAYRYGRREPSVVHALCDLAEACGGFFILGPAGPLFEPDPALDEPEE